MSKRPLIDPRDDDVAVVVGRLWKARGTGEVYKENLRKMRVIIDALEVDRFGTIGTLQSKSEFWRSKIKEPGSGLIVQPHTERMSSPVDMYRNIVKRAVDKKSKASVAQLRDKAKRWSAAGQVVGGEPQFLTIQGKAGPGSLRTTGMLDVLEAVAFSEKVRKSWEERHMLGPLRFMLYGKTKPDPRGGAVKVIAEGSGEYNRILNHTKKWFGTPMDPEGARGFLHVVDTMSKETKAKIIVGDMPATPAMRSALSHLEGMYRTFPEGRKEPITSWRLKKQKAAREKAKLRGTGPLIRDKKIVRAMRAAAEKASPAREGITAAGARGPLAGSFKERELVPDPVVPEVSARHQRTINRFVAAAEKLGVRRDKLTEATKGIPTEGVRIGDDLLEAAEMAGENIDDVTREALGGGRGAVAEGTYGMELTGKLAPGKFGELPQDYEHLQRLAKKYVEKVGLNPQRQGRVAAILGVVAGRSGQESQAALQEAGDLLKRIETLHPTEVEELIEAQGEIGSRRGMARGGVDPSRQHPGESRYVLEQEGLAPGQAEQALKAERGRHAAAFARGQTPWSESLRWKIKQLRTEVDVNDIYEWQKTMAGTERDVHWMKPEALVGKNMTDLQYAEELSKVAPGTLQARYARLKAVLQWKLRAGAAGGALGAAGGVEALPGLEATRAATVLEGPVPTPEARTLMEAAAARRGAEVAPGGLTPRTLPDEMPGFSQAQRGQRVWDLPAIATERITEARRGAPQYVTPTMEGGPTRPQTIPPAQIPRPPQYPGPGGKQGRTITEAGVRGRPPRALPGMRHYTPTGPDVGAKAARGLRSQRAGHYRAAVQALEDAGMLKRGQAGGAGLAEIMDLVQKLQKGRRMANPGGLALMLALTLGAGAGGAALVGSQSAA